MEKINNLKKYDCEFEGLFNTSVRGNILYNKTKQSACISSVNVAKELFGNDLLNLCNHPLIDNENKSILLDDLKSFKPKQT